MYSSRCLNVHVSASNLIRRFISGMTTLSLLIRKLPRSGNFRCTSIFVVCVNDEKHEIYFTTNIIIAISTFQFLIPMAKAWQLSTFSVSDNRPSLLPRYMSTTFLCTLSHAMNAASYSFLDVCIVSFQITKPGNIELIP